MTLGYTNDLFYLVAAIAVVWVAIFLCWALYEAARLLRQTNEVVTETRERIQRVENAVFTVKERIESSTKLVAALVTGGKTVMSMFDKKRKK